MQRIESHQQLQAFIQSQNGKTIGFVPTMGHLHPGHMSLVRAAKQQCDSVVLSIFVNPTQFNNPADLSQYPRTLEQDLELAQAHQVDAVFLPTEAMIYPEGYRFKVCENYDSTVLEGAYRPGHFDGVLTVVLKLFNLVKPQKAFFGEKDHQQFQLIKDMAQALFLDIDVISCPTIRESSGLAMSSRNTRLSQEQKQLAPRLHEWLLKAKTANEASNALRQLGFAVDYVEDKQARRYAAASLGDVRLIDNIPLSECES